MIKIDGVEYKATWLQGLKQSAEILNGEGTGRLQGTGEMYIEPLGTFLNHAGTLHKDSDCTEAEWSNLFLVLYTQNRPEYQPDEKTPHPLLDAAALLSL